MYREIYVSRDTLYLRGRVRDVQRDICQQRYFIFDKQNNGLKRIWSFKLYLKMYKSHCISYQMSNH